MSTSSFETDDLITLNQIAKTLNQAADVSSALNEALARLVDLIGLDAGWIFLRDEQATDLWYGRGFVLAAHYNLPPAMDLNSAEAWKGGCDCQGACNKGQLNEAYNEVRCSRLASVTGDRRNLQVHASSPLRSGEETLGILNVAAPSWDAFSPRSLALLTNVGAQIGVTLERARLFDLLRERRIHEQAALLDLTNQLLGRRNLDDLMQYLVEAVATSLGVDAASLLLLDDKEEHLVFQAATGWRSDPVAEGRRMPADDRSASGWVILNQRPLIIPEDDPKKDGAPTFTSKWLRQEGFETAAIVPLLVEQRAIGALSMDSRQPRQFEDEEIRFLQLMANQAAIAIENARLHEQELVQQRLEEELDVGRRIQLSLLPKSCPVVPGWQFCDIYQAARQVGGDLYDIFELPGDSGQLGLVIGDVSDKGVPAALFMGVSRTLIRSAAFSGRTPGKTLERANEYLLKDSQSGLFLSAFYGILDTQEGRLAYANAGHNPPLWFSQENKDFHELSAKGIVLAVLGKIELEEKVVDIAPNDVLIFYTDGVTEAFNVNYEEYGLDRLRKTVAEAAAGTATDILWAIVDDVNAFTREMNQSDDFTLFIVKRL